MKAFWIIENYTDSDDYNDLIRAVKDSGRESYIIGRRNNFDFDPSVVLANQCVLFQGSIQMTRHAKKVLPSGCFPIAYCTEENYLCSAYYSRFQSLLFNDNHVFTSVADLKERVFDYYAKFGKEALIFVRPDRGDKPFSGQLLDLQDFDRFWKNAVACNATETDRIIISTPKTINGEYRFVVDKWQNIIAASTYIYQGQKTLIPSVPPGATRKCEEVLGVGYYPDSVFCIDIAEDADGNFWLLELTSFSSAGLYAANKDRIVQQVSVIAEKEFLEKL